MQPSKLINSLLEVCVVVGMDEDTHLSPVMSQAKMTKQPDENGSSLFSKDFEPKVLAAVSGEIAYFPFLKTEIQGRPYYEDDAIISLATATPGKAGKIRRSVSVTPGKKALELPVSHEVINSLAPLCLPDGGKVLPSRSDATVHSLVLTDIDGNRTYCSCLTFYKPFMTKENEDSPGNYNLYYMKEEDTKALRGSSYKKCYVPTCCCLISKWPYFSLLKDCLSSLMLQIEKKPSDFRLTLMQFVSQLAMVPVPAPGSLAVEFDICGVVHVLKPADEPDMRVIDMELHYPFLCFSTKDVLVLISAIMTQQRIVFLSSNYSLLTLVIESLFTFIQPFVWSWTYVPVLPSNLIDLVEAPGSYIMGCHSRFKEQISKVMQMEEMSGILIANIDDGKLKVGESMKIPPIPKLASVSFEYWVKRANTIYDFAVVGRPSAFTAEDVRKQREKFTQDFKKAILSASLEMMVSLFSDVTVTAAQKELFFDLEAFIESRPEEDQQFYREVCKTHAFSTFLYNRIQHPGKRDSFAIMAEKTRPATKQGQIRKRSSSQKIHHSADKTDVLRNGVEPSDILTHFILPPFTEEGLYTGSFYEKCLKELDSKIETAQKNLTSSNVLASYLYLRGMFRIGCGQKLEGLEDLFALSSKNVQMFPIETVCDILSQLSREEHKELLKKSFCAKAQILQRKAKERKGYGRERKELLLTPIPSAPLCIDKFIKHVNMLRIASCKEAGKRLFASLSNMGRTTDIGPDEFAPFYEALNEADAEIRSISLGNITLEENEVVLILSTLIKTDRGMGRLLLTAKRLFYLPDCSHECQIVARISEIAQMELCQHYIIIPPGVPALKIYKRERGVAPFTACLKEERQFWHQCLCEVHAGNTLSEERKDLQFIKQASQNVIMADALRRSGHSEAENEHVLYLYKFAKDESRKLSKETREVLVRSVNPSEQEAEQTTVESLLFVSGSKLTSPTVWCGLGSGKVIILCASTWEIQSSLHFARDRVSCMVEVDENVWVGSFDTTIYVINKDKKQADQQLNAHKDYVSEMIKTNEPEGVTVWSASLNGQILGWDTKTLTCTRKIQVEGVKTLVHLSSIGSYFWCATRHAVIVVDKKSGDTYRFLTICDSNSAPRSVDCMCEISQNQVWTGCDKTGSIAVWNTKTFEHKTFDIDSNEGFTDMICVDTKVWAGTRKGTVYVIDTSACRVEKTLHLHEDRIRSTCLTDTGFVVTGPGSKDGKIAVWMTHLVPEEGVDQLDFEFVDESFISFKRN